MSIEFYDNNAASFFKATSEANMSEQYSKFISSIPKGGKILDVGCGSGRDSRAFSNMGFDVTAIDGSSELCKLASDFTGLNVRHMLFEDISWIGEFDGVWACASLLFIPKPKLPFIIQKIANSMKIGAAMYSSFKYGEGYLDDGDKIYTMLNEKSVEEVFGAVADLKLKDVYCSSDVRSGNGTKWINILCKKI